MIEQDFNNDVLTLRLAHGKASVLDIPLLEAISAALAEASANSAVKALVITGTASIFSAGVDLKQILEGGADYAHKYIPILDRVLEELFAFDKPMVSAINGHAIAGGCIVALAADYRLMAAGRGRMGIPELKVGVPFPSSAFEIVRFSVPRSQAQTLYYRASTYLPEEALARGLVDEVLPADEVLAAAEKVAVELASIPGESFSISKRMLRGPVIQQMADNREEFSEDIKARWSADESYAHIQGYLDKTLKK